VLYELLTLTMKWVVESRLYDILTLTGRWLIASPLWSVITQFVMPASAILASGYVAIRVQRKEQLLQAETRRQEAREEAARLRRQTRTSIVEEAMGQNFVYQQYVASKDATLLETILRTQSTTHHLLAMTELEDAVQLGVWLVRKRALLTDHVMKPDLTTQQRQLVLSYIMQMNVFLVDWGMETRSEEWFHDDTERLGATETALEEEIKFYHDLYEFNTDVVLLDRERRAKVAQRFQGAPTPQ
jgi:hypothetical protein